MSENKQFVYYEHKGADYILENPNEDLDFIEMLGDCLEAEEIVNRLNELYNENMQLKSTNMEYEDALGRLEEENEILKEIIKFRYDMEICESCKHGYYWITNDFFGKEGNFKCLKGHPADECMEIKECKDYEIEDLNEMLERVKE